MKSLISIIFLLFLANPALFSQGANASTLKHFNHSKNLALEGYDAVSYFNGNKPTKGKSTIKTTSDGLTYYFSSEKNKAEFNQNPSKYKPQYGGWCAYAMGEKGEKVEINPETFKIIDGKLYLFYNAFFNNTLTEWNKNEATLKTKADKNWKSFLKS
jgi:YHS domain-containing protein